MKSRPGGGRHPSRGGYRALWWLALFLGVFPVAFRQVSVSDAWWHVALGKWLVEERSLPDLNKFYFSPFDAGWVVSELRWEWLGDIVFYLCYAAGGAAGLQWLVIGCVLAGLGFLAMLASKPACRAKEHGRGVSGPQNWRVLLRQRRFFNGDGTATIPPMDSGQHGPWLLLLLVAVCLGTYQLQLARNSVFSLALYPAVLWLGLRRKEPPQWKEYVAVGGVLVFWSCLHGSCVLGWVTAFVILGTRAAGAFRDRKPDAPSGATADGKYGRFLERLYSLRTELDLRSGISALLRLFVAGAVSLVLMTAGRHGAVDFLLLPVRHVVSAVETKSVPDSATMGESAAQAPHKTQSVKEWLNSSIWKPDPGTPWSNDYWSPFDMLPGMRPIEAAFGLAILAAICLAAFRNVPSGLVLAWGGAVFLGAGYVRMFGYTALASGAVIRRSFGARISNSPRWLTRCGWAAVGIWIGFAWWAFFGAKWDALIPEGQHVSRFGKVPIYDDATSDWVKAEFPKDNVFTTIESGSYCLLRWGFEKPVFLDGFFAPHTREVWDAYHAALDTGDLSILHDRFDITVAIIPTTSGPWGKRFLHSPNWNPAAIGAGSMVFLHKTISLQGRSPRMFFTADDLRRTSAYFRYHALRNVFLVAAADKHDGFAPEQWLRQPAFKDFRELAKEVFPAKPAEEGPGRK